LSETTPIEIWFQDEARIGQKNGLVRQWARRGTRPRQPADQRYDNAYLFGAICPARGVGAALALPYADTDMMQLHLDEISSNVAKGAHAVVLLDRAGWHITSKLDMPENITPIFLPSRAPELNPVENVWQYSVRTGSQTPSSKITTPLSTLPATHGGVGGNIHQWVPDCWHENYQGAPSDGSAWVESDCLARVIRSGSWKNDPSYVRPSNRDHYDATVRYPTHGLRVAYSQ